MKYNVLIVDDEFLARKLLLSYLEKIDDMNVVGTAANAFEAFSLVKENKVDILLLDIHMPDLNGLDFAKSCVSVPAIIFTTAYSEHALESFEADAVDYLLKPIAFLRFQKAIDKAKMKINGLLATGNEDSVVRGSDNANMGEDKTDQPKTRDYIMVKADYKMYKINYADLLYIEGQREYVSFYTTTKRITALYSLKSLEGQLPSDLFARVHKSYIVSINNISEVGTMSVTVAGVSIPVGGSYRDNFLSKLRHAT